MSGPTPHTVGSADRIRCAASATSSGVTARSLASWSSTGVTLPREHDVVAEAGHHAAAVLEPEEERALQVAEGDLPLALGDAVARPSRR